MPIEGARFFGRKIDRYLELYADDSRLPLPVWPLILTVAPTEARASELRRATEAILRARTQMSGIGRAFRFTYLDALRGDEGPFGEIWQIPGRTGRFPLAGEPATVASVSVGRREGSGA
jgi:hypothetical protein